MISVPVMSLGMRSGVNWTRLKLSSSASATVWTISVLARPGTPISRAWPPARTAVRMPSTTSSWPTIRCATWARRRFTAATRRSSC